MIYYKELKQLGLLYLESLEEDKDEAIEKKEYKLLEMDAPEIFGGEEGVEVSTVNSFVNTCIMLDQSGITSSETISTLAYFKKIDVIKDQNK